MWWALQPEKTVSAFISFIHLMALHGDVQGKAQEEIDAWRGATKCGRSEYSVMCEEGEELRDELPSCDELESERFPYLTSVLKEVLRYAPVGPLGEPSQ